MTRRLYNEDGYMQSFQANVISCEAYDEATYKVVLDRTAFFPEGGGQSSDVGTLNGIEVIHVQDVHAQEEDEIFHILREPIEIGTRVEGRINWEQRFDKMQQHTAEHIVSGLMNHLHGFQNVGFHLSKDIVTMDFNGVINRLQANELEVLVNRAVYENVSVEIEYPNKEALEKLSYRSKIEINGQVRLVSVIGYDVCACCAPHVKKTGEIGQVKLTDIQSHRGGMRITMKCGMRALLDYQEKSGSVKKLSGMLSAKEDEVVQGVERLQEEIQKSYSDNWNLQNIIQKNKIEEIQRDSEQEWILVFEQELDVDHVRALINELVVLTKEMKENAIKVVAVFMPNQDGYQYIIGSQLLDVRSFGKYINEVCNGRGGGKSMMVQGSVKSTELEIKEAFYDYRTSVIS